MSNIGAIKFEKIIESPRAPQTRWTAELDGRYISISDGRVYLNRISLDKATQDFNASVSTNPADIDELIAVLALVRDNLPKDGE
jgi:hypothetical protein